MSAKTMTGAKMVVQALIDQGVDTVFGYPGGAVLPIYDEIFQQNSIKLKAKKSQACYFLRF